MTSIGPRWNVSVLLFGAFEPTICEDGKVMPVARHDNDLMLAAPLYDRGDPNNHVHNVSVSANIRWVIGPCRRLYNEVISFIVIDAKHEGTKSYLRYC